MNKTARLIAWATAAVALVACVLNLVWGMTSQAIWYGVVALGAMGAALLTGRSSGR